MAKKKKAKTAKAAKKAAAKKSAAKKVVAKKKVVAMKPKKAAPAKRNGVVKPNGLPAPSTAVWGAAGKALEDRKSTRLNSSHLGISYAVFCLKKKKKQRNTGHTKNTHVGE